MAAAYLRESNRTVIVTTPKPENIQIAPDIAQQRTGAPVAAPVELKNRAPVSTKALEVRMPRPFEAHLENGLTVLVFEDHRFPMVHTMFTIRGAGSIDEPPELRGLAGMVAQMLVEGSANRSGREIAEQAAALGSALSGSSGFGSSAAVVDGSGVSGTF